MVTSDRPKWFGLFMGAANYSLWLLVTLYMQQVLGRSALETGFGYLAVAATAVIWANVAAQAVSRIGVIAALAGTKPEEAGLASGLIEEAA
jgi:hypothetical protein